MASAMDSGLRPPRGRPTGACRRGCSAAASRAEVCEQLLAPRRRPEQSDVGDRCRGQDAQVRQIGGQVMAHDDRGGKVPQLECARELGRSCQEHPLGGRKVRCDRVRCTMIHQGDFPVEPHCEVHHRHRVGPGAEQQHARRQCERHDEQPPGALIEPLRLPLRDRPHESGLHGGRCELRGGGMRRDGQRHAARLRDPRVRIRTPRQSPWQRARRGLRRGARAAASHCRAHTAAAGSASPLRTRGRVPTADHPRRACRSAPLSPRRSRSRCAHARAGHPRDNLRR